MSHSPKQITAILASVLLQGALVNAANAPTRRWPFDDSAVRFTGTEMEQAKCLLRPVKPFAHLGERLANLPSPLDELIGRDTTISKEAFRRLLRDRNIQESQIGGSLDEPLSRANNNASTAGFALYFVIHDTSTPNLLNDPFPGTINTPAWEFNNFSKYGAVAHVFVNRVGESATKVGFRTPFRATKFETQVLGQRGKGLFIHVEMIQPRRRDPRGGARNDALAPDPGFTEAQLDRLALIYVAASLRRGHWLVPAYHAVLDTGLRNAHDDPQKFDLNAWAGRLKLLLDAVPQ